MSSKATQRSIFRWIHLVFSIPILGYIYSPFDKLPNYAPATRYVFVPVMVLSGLWMWKGHVVRRLISKRSAVAQVRTRTCDLRSADDVRKAGCASILALTLTLNLRQSCIQHIPIHPCR